MELSTGVAGPFCGKLFADYGADVIKVEPPGSGDVTRQWGPFRHDHPHPEESGLFFFLNTNKLGITLRPELPRGKEIFERLAAQADVLVEDWPPGHLEALGLGHEELRRRNPGLIVASITPFGRSGPYKDYRAYPLNIAHAGGQGYVLPMPSLHLERAPTRIDWKSIGFCLAVKVIKH